MLARSYFLVLASGHNNEEINKARRHIESHKQQALNEHRKMCSSISNNTESSDGRVEDIKRHTSEEIVSNVLITSYLLDRNSGTNRNLLSKSVTMTQDSVEQVRTLHSSYQPFITLGSTILHRFLKEILLGRKPDVSSRDQMSAEPVLRMLRNRQEGSN